MTEKYAAIARMKSMMKDKNLTSVFLENIVYTTWPGENKPYSIREVTYNLDDNKLVMWQHWDQTNTGHYIEDFEDEKVFRIERELENSIKALKKYRVVVSGWIDIMATSPENAKKTINRHSGPEIKNSIYCIEATDNIKEL